MARDTAFAKGDRVTYWVKNEFYAQNAEITAMRYMKATDRTFVTLKFDPSVFEAMGVHSYHVSGIDTADLSHSIVAECGCMTEPDQDGNEYVATHSSSCELFMD